MNKANGNGQVFSVPTVRKKLSDLRPAKYNPRTIKDEAYSGLRSSINKFGYVEPIVWNKRTGRIVGGHQRYKALVEQARGNDPEVDVVQVDLSEAEEKALNVTLNNPHIQGEFDLEKLSIVLEDIKIDLPEYQFLRMDKLEINLDENDNGESQTKDLSGNDQVSFKLEISLQNEAQQEELFNELVDRGYKCRVLTL